MKKQMAYSKKISIVILTHTRTKYVEQLFKSLYRELKSFDGIAEVIVVDDSRTKESTAIAKICNEYKYKFFFFKGSISAKRNFGIEKCSNDVILFIDSDCEVTPGLLHEHIVSYSQENIGSVLGLTNFIGRENWVWKVIDKTPFTIAFSFAKRMDYAPWGPCTNISFRKDIIEKVSRFRTEFPFDFSAEDVDIGLRINKLGYKIKCNPKAIINHYREPWSNFLKFGKKIFRWGRADFHILNHHPELSNLEFPKLVTVLLLILALFVIGIFISIGKEIGKLLIIWILCVPLIETLLRSYKAKEKATAFLFAYLSIWLTFIFELGALFESLKNGSLSMLYKKISYGPGQLIFEWKSKILQNWSFIIGLFIALFLLLM